MRMRKSGDLLECEKDGTLRITRRLILFLMTRKYGCGSYDDCRSFSFAPISVSKEMLSIRSLPRICRAGITADAIPLISRILRCV